MEAYRTEITLVDDGKVTIGALPFRAGERVEIIILSARPARFVWTEDDLPGAPLSYDRPTDPVTDDGREPEP